MKVCVVGPRLATVGDIWTGCLTLGRAVFRDDVEAFTRGDGDGTS